MHFRTPRFFFWDFSPRSGHVEDAKLVEMACVAVSLTMTAPFLVFRTNYMDKYHHKGLEHNWSNKMYPLEHKWRNVHISGLFLCHLCSSSVCLVC